MNLIYYLKGKRFFPLLDIIFTEWGSRCKKLYVICFRFNYRFNSLRGKYYISEKITCRFI